MGMLEYCKQYSTRPVLPYSVLFEDWLSFLNLAYPGGQQQKVKKFLQSKSSVVDSEPLNGIMRGPLLPFVRGDTVKIDFLRFGFEYEQTIL